jgi:hypothetical protein
MHEERMALNEALARDTNEMVERIAGRWSDFEPMVFRCECARDDCQERIRLTREEYESVRSEGTRFVVVEGHVEPQVERVVGHIREYPLVEKTDPEVREIAEDTDPRGRDR